MLARTGEELLKICEEESISLSEYAIRIEMRDRELSREEVYKKMAKNLKVMKDGATEGREKQVNSLSGLIGGDGYRVQKYLEKGNTLTGDITVKAMAMALSSSEVNASMGRIVACPTAGSCGILPAVILSAGEKLGKSDEELIDALFASAAVGKGQGTWDSELSNVKLNITTPSSQITTGAYTGNVTWTLVAAP